MSRQIAQALSPKQRAYFYGNTVEDSTHSETDPCLLWQGHVSASGFGRACFWIGGRPHTVDAHRVAWELAFGTDGGFDPRQHVTVFTCGNKHCLSVGHMRLKSKAEAMDEARNARGREKVAALVDGIA